ncbi:Envelope glycoprotein [Gonapodya sp. JEL0774]|nr:Envelope glycoprotein [Gonapodya sp. JEL0774]
MLPPPPKPKPTPSTGTLASKLPAHVLDEDEYIEGLAHVIQRDYFPDLDKMRASAEYLDAVESGDGDRVRDATWQLARTTGRVKGHAPATPFSSLGTPRATPSFAASHLDTPRRGPSASDPARASSPTPSLSTLPVSSAPPDSSLTLSLTAYQATYTSEDNSSFAEQLDRENERKRDKFAWAYEAEAKARIEDGKRARNTYNGRPLVSDGDGGTVLLIEDGRKESVVVVEGATSVAVDSRSSTETEDPSVQVDPNVAYFNKAPDRPAGPSGWRNHVAQNSLMYPPQGADLTPSERIASGPPPEIVRSNTRLPKTSTSSSTDTKDGKAAPRLTLAPSDSQLRADSAVERRLETHRVFHAMSASTPGLFAPSQTGRPPGSATPSFGYVPASPSIAPSDLPPDMLMTWGDIEATPMLLEAVGDIGSVEDTAGPRFSLPPTPRREELAVSLGRKAGAKTREAASSVFKAGGVTPRVRPHSPAVDDRVRALSPAGRTLLKRAGVRAASGLGGGGGGWTAMTPRGGGVSVKRRKVGDSLEVAGGDAKHGAGGSVTDGLLAIGD